MLSVLYIPHLIALPAKTLSYLLSKLPITQYLVANRRVRAEFEVHFYNGPRNIYEPLEPEIQSLASFNASLSSLTSDFYHVQLLLLSQFALFSFAIIEVFNWLIIKIEFSAKKVLSGFSYVPLTSNNLGMALARPRLLWLLRTLQVPIGLFFLAVRVSYVVLPIYLSYAYSNYTWLGCLFGPAFVNLFCYVSLWFNICTVRNYQAHFRFYTPYQNLARAAYQIVYQPYRIVVIGVKLLLSALRYVIVTPLKFLMSFLTRSSVGLVQAYINILYISGRVLKPLRILGDILFIPVTLAWMWWPLVVCYYVEESWLWIPSAILSAFLTVKGYAVANRAWA